MKILKLLSLYHESYEKSFVKIRYLMNTLLFLVISYPSFSQISGKVSFHHPGRITLTGSSQTPSDALQTNIIFMNKKDLIFYNENTLWNGGSRIEGGILKNVKKNDIDITYGFISFNEIDYTDKNTYISVLMGNVSYKMIYGRIAGEIFYILNTKDIFGSYEKGIIFTGVSCAKDYKNISYSFKQDVLLDKGKILSLPLRGRILIHKIFDENISLGGDGVYDFKKKIPKISASITYDF